MQYDSSFQIIACVALVKVSVWNIISSRLVSYLKISKRFLGYLYPKHNFVLIIRILSFGVT